ncbi:MAG: amino acid ABC transporter permease [Schaalia hyovaginalis]|uniref:amino acid ABC transporter permease n=1 Tax=Schaalia hyovaginalis TaxID=29316 RepID=UPI00139E5DD2|nr:amino acid ABC transporter permease [Schaalia hyovaginalis]MCI6411086.1 amino acid ABC transporter permease [Schaalia hyovaginalis]MCI7513421.1 amino acid ABC transporter permease [Schaalia hyovaginalis]MDY4263107.1 amino acid ABC transporter permease [Schaalia hyovaginalis]MDY5600827.1 amino acid ABC transporter permease [Schaalia hyovaginalis]MDY6214612.1 amino acid ABC transporter permease [Schaalia hyovaginalis]
MDTTALDLLSRSIWPLARGALAATIPLTLASFAIGLVIAILIALARLSESRILRGLAGVYVSLIRGTPLLVQLFVIFYALPQLGVVIDPFPSAILAFSLNVGGYTAETIRAAILSVPTGQWEAAETIGLDRATTLRRVIAPQALRVAVPPLFNTFIGLVKDTSLASSIMVSELLREAQIIAAPSYRFLLLYSLAALYYWLICAVLAIVQSRIEKKLEARS